MDGSSATVASYSELYLFAFTATAGGGLAFAGLRHVHLDAPLLREQPNVVVEDGDPRAKHVVVGDASVLAKLLKVRHRSTRAEEAAPWEWLLVAPAAATCCHSRAVDR